MTRIIHAFTLGLLLNTGSALALTVETGVDGPLFKPDSLRQFVKQKVTGAVAGIADIDQGGRHRLRVLVSTKYLEPSSYSYLVEMQLQRRVVEEGSGRLTGVLVKNDVLLALLEGKGAEKRSSNTRVPWKSQGD